MQVSRVSWLAQAGFAAFGKEAQLISDLPYAETEQLPTILPGRGSEKARNDYPGVSNVFMYPT